MNSINIALWKYPVHFLAYGLGSGFIPFAPGTMGTLVGVAIFWFMARLSTLSYAAITLIMAAVGIFICDQRAGFLLLGGRFELLSQTSHRSALALGC